MILSNAKEVIKKILIKSFFEGSKGILREELDEDFALESSFLV